MLSLLAQKLTEAVKSLPIKHYQCVREKIAVVKYHSGDAFLNLKLRQVYVKLQN